MSKLSFDFIPAIDLLNRQCVRLYQGDYSQSTLYEKDPVKQALYFAECGIRWLHLVDLNGAIDGTNKTNLSTIQAIIKALGDKVHIEIGGGIRSIESIKEYLELGVRRCIIGTAAVKNPKLLEQALGLYTSEAIWVGVDIKDTYVYISGWEEKSALDALVLLKNIEKIGIQNVIFTDIQRDGTLSGPGEVLFDYIKSCQLNFILSGGISCLEDLENILSKKHPRLLGAISGKALYEKKIDLKAALNLVN